MDVQIYKFFCMYIYSKYMTMYAYNPKSTGNDLVIMKQMHKREPETERRKKQINKEEEQYEEEYKRKTSASSFSFSFYFNF